MKNLRLVVALLSLSTMLIAQAAEYTIVDLGPGQANAINSSGQVVGARLTYFEESPGAHNLWQAMLWSPDTNYSYTSYELGWLPTALGWFTNAWGGSNPWAPYSSAMAISDDGHITGSSTVELTNQYNPSLGVTEYWYGYRAFLWTPNATNSTNGTMSRIAPVHDVPDELRFISGFAINNSNHVFGGSLFDGGYTAAYRQEFPSESLTIWGTNSTVGLQLEAIAANNVGVWAGRAWQESDEVEENYWFPNTAYAGGTFLGTLMGTNTYHALVGDSKATAINNSNNVVGISWYAPNMEEFPEGEYRAVMWTGLSPTSITNLGTLTTNDTWSIALGISDAGKVVGSSGEHGSLWGPGYQVVPRAFVWDNANGMRDLNDLIPAESGWVLHAARAINNSGWVVGYGTKVINLCPLETEEHAFLLVPNP